MRILERECRNVFKPSADDDFRRVSASNISSFKFANHLTEGISAVIYINIALNRLSASKIAQAILLQLVQNTPPPTNPGGRHMNLTQKRSSQGNVIFFVSLLTLVFAPHDLKMP